jgi:hypothetical protein
MSMQAYTSSVEIYTNSLILNRQASQQGYRFSVDHTGYLTETPKYMRKFEFRCL